MLASCLFSLWIFVATGATYNTKNDTRRLLEIGSGSGAAFKPEEWPEPLWRDPIFDGAADPTVIWDNRRKEWRIFYTQRRAKGSEALPGVSWCYGTAIATATSSDFGAHWKYRKNCCHFTNRWSAWRSLTRCLARQ